jgi:hypothetical protein
VHTNITGTAKLDKKSSLSSSGRKAHSLHDVLTCVSENNLEYKLLYINIPSSGIFVIGLLYRMRANVPRLDVRSRG